MNLYYGDLCTKVYEQDKSVPYEKELSFYLSFVKHSNVKVLEPMCGNGRMLIPFLKQEINIEGFDISPSMLEKCIEKAKAFNLNARVYVQDITDFNKLNEFDLILIPFGSFSLLPYFLVRKSLENMKHALKPGGKFILTVMFKPESITQYPDWIELDTFILPDETITLYKKALYDDQSSVLHTTLKYVAMNKQNEQSTETMDFPVRYYEPDEFTQLLKECGFSTIQLHHIVDGYGAGHDFHAYECSI